MNKLIRPIFYLLLIVGLFSFSYGLDSTGNLLLNGNFSSLETKNYIDIIVFLVVIALIVSVIEQSLGKYVPIPAKAFKLLIVIFLISYFWILLTSFGGDALVFTLVWISLIGILAICFVVWNSIRQDNAISSPNSLYGFLAAYVVFVILVTAIRGINSQGFENSTLMQAILLLSFGGVSTESIIPLIVMIIFGILLIYITRQISNTTENSKRDPHNDISKHIKSENQQRSDFNRHYQALYDGINEINRISHGKDEKTLDDNTRNNQRNLIFLLLREVKELLKLATTEMRKNKKKYLGFKQVIIETNPYNNQQLVQYLSQIEAIFTRVSQNQPIQITAHEIEGINRLYEQLNNVVTQIDASIQQDLKNYAQIDSFLEKIKSEYLNKIESQLSAQKLKEYQSKSKPGILKIILDELLHTKDLNPMCKFIEESVGYMISHYPTDKTQQAQIKIEKIKNLDAAFKSCLLYKDLLQIQHFWASYWASK